MYAYFRCRCMFNLLYKAQELTSQYILSYHTKSDFRHLPQNFQNPAASQVGSEHIQLTTRGTIRLVGDILVSQQRFHQPKATARAVRQANHLAVPSAISIANIGPSLPEET